MKVPFISGSVVLKTDLSLEEVGDILSKLLFGQLPFEGREDDIYEEVPAIYIKSKILGLLVVLSSGYDTDDGYATVVLDLTPVNNIGKDDNVQFEECKFENYLEVLVREELKNVDSIEVIE